MPGETDAKNVKQLAKQDLLTFFDTYIHHPSPTRRKLSVHLTSQRKNSIKFSVAASEALLELLKKEGVPVEEGQYRELSAAEPPLDAVVGFWTNHLAGQASSSIILPRIPEICSQYPAAGAEQDFKLPDTVTRIKDISKFKSLMTVSCAPTPINS